ncbi:MAG: hypothetical protein EPO00_12760 [Chloroflexota bacterium]|nr:MAG: hypothetical protein EPO00_12760 [Chloroflexota bacterium]
MPAPDAYRLKQAKGLDRRRRGLPLPARLLLVLALAGLGGAVFLTAGGGIGTLAGALSTSVSGFFDKIVATPEPSASEVLAADAPVVATPSEPYTNLTTVDLKITVPVVTVGNPLARLRIYLTLEGQEPAVIAEVPIGSTVRMIVPVELTPGRNDFHATIAEAGVESEPSPIVTFILDTDPPKIVLTSPKDGGTVNRPTAVLVGTTQPRTTLLARNSTNGQSFSGVAGTDGTFSLALPLEPGANAITISGRDPAGNMGELALTVVRGSGKLTATLTSSAYRIATSSLPVSLQLSVLVIDPDGQPITGAAITFTLTVPGIPPVSKDTVTGGDGRATFSTTLPKGVTVGNGIATVFVTTTDYGTTSAAKTINVVK